MSGTPPIFFWFFGFVTNLGFVVDGCWVGGVSPTFPHFPPLSPTFLESEMAYIKGEERILSKKVSPIVLSELYFLVRDFVGGGWGSTRFDSHGYVSFNLVGVITKDTLLDCLEFLSEIKACEG